MANENDEKVGVTPEMRAVSERGVAQAKAAYESYASTTEKTFNSMDDWCRQAWSGAREVNARMLAFADQNARAGFDYAERLVKAPDSAAVLALQQEYMKESGERMSQQMKELRELATRAARETTEAGMTKASS